MKIWHREATVRKTQKIKGGEDARHRHGHEHEQKCLGGSGNAYPKNSAKRYVKIWNRLSIERHAQVQRNWDGQASGKGKGARKQKVRLFVFVSPTHGVWLIVSISLHLGALL